ncbi:PBSX family phage terminase large subunit [Methanothermococcus sp.]|uniref:PBSX family phage terminase large subunit n=1 Tax=Methanothermococcus sp. TaxID=2614238 RepID=UPI0025834C63|nr:PBSX family phage terminase large subunit [Methanothermococcus sp.]
MNPIYRKAYKTKNRYRILYGGAGSGKSHFVAQETILNMLNNRHMNYLVVRKVGKTLRNSVFRLLTDLINEYDLNGYFNINKTEMSISCLSGAKLITSGLDDVEKLKSITGINRIWIEEASEITEKDFNQLDLRLRGASQVKYQMTLTFNPISELHWLKKTFFDVGKLDSYVLKTTYLDNKFLDKEYRRVLNHLQEEDYQYYRIYALGEWGTLGNLIYTNWEKKNLTKMQFDNIFHGVDFGFSNDPTAYVKLHYDKKHKTIYILDELYQTDMFIDELAAELKDKVNNYVMCDSSEPRSIEDLRRHGINARAAKKGPDSVEHGIKFIQRHKIIVDSSCINTIKELTSYKWKEDKNGNVLPKPVDANNHILDALRYALETEMSSNGIILV